MEDALGFAEKEYLNNDYIDTANSLIDFMDEKYIILDPFLYNWVIDKALAVISNERFIN